ncbi:MAG: hypothetical protein MK135_16180, partial [Polyangiaceae bacterium]|nr:hypothetical protein [Polyangiaceae bacterium]
FARSGRWYERFSSSSERFAIDTRPAGCRIAVRDEGELAGCAVLYDLANHPEILAAVRAYLGVEPVISSMSLWWSFAFETASRDAELFHRDVDDWKFVKAFFYLTDVGQLDGPHTYVPGSFRSNKLLRIRRYQDQEITDVFGENSPRSFEGKAGTFFLEDTFGFHKGGRPVANDRLLFQVQYSAQYIPGSPYPKPEQRARFPQYSNLLNRYYVS